MLGIIKSLITTSFTIPGKGIIVIQFIEYRIRKDKLVRKKKQVGQKKKIKFVKRARLGQ